ncbi:uncharacterized protein LTR77_010068 [Saxophila tyrrhenica]|uniref:Major facilitator superfamily (MFS) profile domain-containing protein n=1 Tax=Saxophila tyrrhenica TaxID=1690608 RepID=A0AAV9NZL1_9PEZI|nr:hypothetical protein LTR77_010068 [Saxophila tyrrhenica]
MEMLRPIQPASRFSEDGMDRSDDPKAPHEPMLASAQLSHTMDPSDPECPKNWPLHRKLYTSFAAWMMAASVAYGLTCYTIAIPQVTASFDFNPSGSATYLPVGPISGYSVYFFGIVFAPIWTPHVAERIGRSIIYLTALPLCGVFLLGAGFSQTFAGVAILRFLAGLSGGPCLVLLEGTFADIWSAETTNTYYAFQVLAQFFGTALGPIIGGYLVEATDGWRWTQWISAAVCGAVWVFGIGISETYQREIPRRLAKRAGRVLEQDPALSGVTFGEMFRITVLDPIRQVFTEPVVALCTFMLIFNFAVVLQFFITVPVALGSAPPAGPGWTPSQVGRAFTSAIAGSGLAALVVVMIDQVTTGSLMKRNMPTFAQVEYRLIPAMLGPLLVTAGLFWIGATVGNPSFPPIVPIAGTGVLVWGVAMVIMSIIPYLFDAFPPAGTLSALTAAASARLLFAGALPLVILQFFTGVTPKWALFIFGFISIPMWVIPFVLFRYGAILREKSRYSKVSNIMGHEEERMSAMGGETAYDNGA